MADVFFTSDTHFGHKRILEFCPTTRKGKDSDEMTELMIASWQKQVKPEDTVYMLGDISWYNHKKTIEVLNRLTGHLYLVLGNHDKGLRGDALKRFEHVDMYMIHKIAGIDVIMFHYPIVEWDKMHHGSYHLYGHVHGKDMGLSDRRCMDVGIDARPNGDMKLWSWDEVHSILKERKVFSHH